MPVFPNALRQGGYLFLGSLENVSRQSALFTAVDRKLRILQRRDHVPLEEQVP